MKKVFILIPILVLLMGNLTGQSTDEKNKDMATDSVNYLAKSGNLISKYLSLSFESGYSNHSVSYDFSNKTTFTGLIKKFEGDANYYRYNFDIFYLKNKIQKITNAFKNPLSTFEDLNPFTSKTSGYEGFYEYELRFRSMSAKPDVQLMSGLFLPIYKYTKIDFDSASTVKENYIRWLCFGYKNLNFTENDNVLKVTNYGTMGSDAYFDAFTSGVLTDALMSQLNTENTDADLNYTYIFFIPVKGLYGQHHTKNPNKYIFIGTLAFIDAQYSHFETQDFKGDGWGFPVNLFAGVSYAHKIGSWGNIKANFGYQYSYCAYDYSTDDDDSNEEYSFINEFQQLKLTMQYNF